MTPIVSDQELAAAVEELPPVTVVLQRLVAVLHDPNSDLDDIARLVRADIALSTKVMRLANSAHYGLSARVASIEEAIQQVGVAEIHRLVSVLGGRQLIARTLERYGITADLLWHHTLAVAVAAEVLAEEFDLDRSMAHLVGMLHPIGFVALERVAAARKLAARTTDVPLLDWEREQFGADNSEAAARVMRHWKFPEPLIAAVGARYEPPAAGAPRSLGGVLHLASCLAERMTAGLPPEGGIFRLSAERIAAAGLDEARVHELETRAASALARTRTLLQLA